MKKKFWIALVVLFLVAIAFALTQGPNNPGAGANNASTGSVAWTTPANVTANDNTGTSAASLSSLGSPTSQLLQATSFGFSIPANATVNGISVSVKKGFTGTNIWDNSIKIMKAGTATGTEKADTATIWSQVTSCSVGTGWGTASYGGAADLWGTTWIPSDINASNFGVQVQAQNKNSSTSTACVDVVSVTVTYTPGPKGSLLKLFSRARTQTRTMGRG